MSRYPREARSARIKCIACNAPVVRTVEGKYVCVDCGDSPLRPRAETPSATD
ncbi:hypothetical protein HAPAU_25170 [Halalkalicoccus paucihalophilus]|jgi:predicted RNA-binding Zn-ribbon protein involved in translation (DUF1610 family)|uniref:Viral late gene transcription factor 3 zinc ribbon domain-containing protein n=1 Tax=Halalkalicoccus paucihalophilus TaxID=1008153 RepID=A0A151ADX0_9EURY|nr:hypothetical protein [Halalkalicoccus paucihalophilus]KYH25839.1 hypothetical protein HAPAU_25170 [Halalkalicoccus paucihalophilus]